MYPGGEDEIKIWEIISKRFYIVRPFTPYELGVAKSFAAGILGAMIWAIRNPHAGIVDSEELDHHVVMEAALPYLGTMLAEYTDWTPLAQRGELFPEKLDKKDPWQFNNFLVS